MRSCENEASGPWIVVDRSFDRPHHIGDFLPLVEQDRLDAVPQRPGGVCSEGCCLGRLVERTTVAAFGPT